MAHLITGGGGDRRSLGSRRGAGGWKRLDEKVTLQEVALTNLDVRDKMWNVRKRASHS